jgi:chromosome segregation ATPase
MEAMVKVPDLVEERTNFRPPYEMTASEKPRDVGLHGIDKLVQDLMASQKNLEGEKGKVAERDAEITRLQEKVAQLMDEAREDGRKRDSTEAKVQELERMSALHSAHDEEVNELRRLLAFHQTNGERVSRQYRDLQATNKELQASLQATNKAIDEQISLISSLGLQDDRSNS